MTLYVNGVASGTATDATPAASTGALAIGRAETASSGDTNYFYGYRKNATTFTYNADGLLTQEVEPVTATSSVSTFFGYDAAGNRTKYTDGNGNNWWTTYNSWNLPATKVEPATTAYSTAANSTFTMAYDADGRPVTETQPGGATVSDSYDSMGNLKGQSGAGASAATASRTFGYDQAGDLMSASTTAAGSQAATSESFSYDDRGLLLSATGTAGSSSMSYNGDGQVASVNDAAGATGYSYDSAGRLATMTDPATGTVLSYSYNSMDGVAQISYGTGADTYDEANRLTSWNNGATTTNYAYDGAGNLTQAGSRSYTYDARDELAADGTNTYSYAANGTLASEVTPAGTVASTRDAYGQQVSTGPESFGSDALGQTNEAPGVQLGGPSTESATPHYEATQAQRTAGIGGAYGAERQVAAMSLTAAGLSQEEVVLAMGRADSYLGDDPARTRPKTPHPTATGHAPAETGASGTNRPPVT